MIIYPVCSLTFYVIGMLGPERLFPLRIIFLSVAIIALMLAGIQFFPNKNAGLALLTERDIQLHPKKDDGYFPSSPILLEQNTKVVITTVSSIRWWSSYILLHVEIINNDSSSFFGLTIKNRKQEKQYLKVLDSWYSNGFPIEEYAGAGGRVFKLEQGNSYADIQKIKSEYGINW